MDDTNDLIDLSSEPPGSSDYSPSRSSSRQPAKAQLPPPNELQRRTRNSTRASRNAQQNIEHADVPDAFDVLIPDRSTNMLKYRQWLDSMSRETPQRQRYVLRADRITPVAARPELNDTLVDLPTKSSRLLEGGHIGVTAGTPRADVGQTDVDYDAQHPDLWLFRYVSQGKDPSGNSAVFLDDRESDIQATGHSDSIEFFCIQMQDKDPSRTLELQRQHGSALDTYSLDRKRADEVSKALVDILQRIPVPLSSVSELQKRNIFRSAVRVALGTLKDICHVATAALCKDPVSDAESLTFKLDPANDLTELVLPLSVFDNDRITRFPDPGPFYSLDTVPGFPGRPVVRVRAALRAAHWIATDLFFCQGDAEHIMKYGKCLIHHLSQDGATSAAQMPADAMEAKATQRGLSPLLDVAYGGRPIFNLSEGISSDTVTPSSAVLEDCPGLPVIYTGRSGLIKNRVCAAILENFLQTGNIEEAWLAGSFTADSLIEAPEHPRDKCACSEKLSKTKRHHCDSCLADELCVDLLKPRIGSSLHLCKTCRPYTKASAADPDTITLATEELRNTFCNTRHYLNHEFQKMGVADKTTVDMEVNRTVQWLNSMVDVDDQGQTVIRDTYFDDTSAPVIAHTTAEGDDVEEDDAKTNPFSKSIDAVHQVYLKDGQLRLHTPENLGLTYWYANLMKLNFPVTILPFLRELICCNDEESRRKLMPYLDHLFLIHLQTPYDQTDRFKMRWTEDQWREYRTQCETGIASQAGCRWPREAWIFKNGKLFRPDTPARLEKLSNLAQVKSTIAEIEVLANRKVPLVDGIPYPFDASPRPDRWSWTQMYALMVVQLHIMTTRCNKKWVTTVTVPVLIIILIWCYLHPDDPDWADFLGISLSPYARHPAMYSAGKRQHGSPMLSGLSNDDDFDTLADFDWEKCNILFESWTSNNLKADWPKNTLTSILNHFRDHLRIDNAPYWTGTLSPLPDELPQWKQTALKPEQRQWEAFENVRMLNESDATLQQISKAKGVVLTSEPPQLIQAPTPGLLSALQPPSMSKIDDRGFTCDCCGKTESPYWTRKVPGKQHCDACDQQAKFLKKKDQDHANMTWEQLFAELKPARMKAQAEKEEQQVEYAPSRTGAPCACCGTLVAAEWSYRELPNIFCNGCRKAVDGRVKLPEYEDKSRDKIYREIQLDRIAKRKEAQTGPKRKEHYIPFLRTAVLMKTDHGLQCACCGSTHAPRWHRDICGKDYCETCGIHARNLRKEAEHQDKTAEQIFTILKPTRMKKKTRLVPPTKGSSCTCCGATEAVGWVYGDPPHAYCKECDQTVKTLLSLAENDGRTREEMFRRIQPDRVAARKAAEQGDEEPVEGQLIGGFDVPGEGQAGKDSTDNVPQYNCTSCHEPDEEAYMLSCSDPLHHDIRHFWCWSLQQMPEGTWFCSDCTARADRKVIYSPTERNLSRLKDTCYVSTALQILRMFPHLLNSVLNSGSFLFKDIEASGRNMRRWISGDITGKDQQQLIDMSHDQMNLLKEVIQSMRNIFTELCSGSNKPVPHNLMQAFMRSLSNWHPQWQCFWNDSGALFQDLIDGLILASDNSSPIDRSKYEDLEQQQAVRNESGEPQLRLSTDTTFRMQAFKDEGRRSPLVDRFFMQVVAEHQCPEPGCGRIARTFSHDQVFRLAFPDDTTETQVFTLKELLHLWATQSVPQGAECPYNPKEHQRATIKPRRITACPDVLTIEFTRAVSFVGAARYNDVAIPQYLDLAEFADGVELPSEARNDHKNRVVLGLDTAYRLVAVNLFIPIGTHYIAYCLLKNQWHMFDDVQYPRPAALRHPQAGIDQGGCVSFAVYEKIAGTEISKLRRLEDDQLHPGQILKSTKASPPTISCPSADKFRCSRVFSSVAEAEQHNEEHLKRNKCGTCQLRFDTRAELDDHCARVHRAPSPGGFEISGDDGVGDVVGQEAADPAQQLLAHSTEPLKTFAPTDPKPGEKHDRPTTSGTLAPLKPAKSPRIEAPPEEPAPGHGRRKHSFTSTFGLRSKTSRGFEKLRPHIPHLPHIPRLFPRSRSVEVLPYSGPKDGFSGTDSDPFRSRATLSGESDRMEIEGPVEPVLSPIREERSSHRASTLQTPRTKRYSAHFFGDDFDKDDTDEQHKEKLQQLADATARADAARDRVARDMQALLEAQTTARSEHERRTAEVKAATDQFAKLQETARTDHVRRMEDIKAAEDRRAQEYKALSGASEQRREEEEAVQRAHEARMTEAREIVHAARQSITDETQRLDEEMARLVAKRAELQEGLRKLPNV